jgi:hypothetical protein
MPKQIIRLLIAFVVFISLFLVARHFLVPDSFYKLGHYRADAIGENIDHEIKYVNDSLCAKCHVGIDSVKHSGAHGKINCQTCHGAGYKHVLNPKTDTLRRPHGRDFCAQCHNKLTARPTGIIKQVDVSKHNIKSGDCQKCHKPHDPSMRKKVAAGDSSKTKGTSASSAACETCHAAQVKLKSSGEHASLLCTSCHGTGEKHIDNPTANVLRKPGERAFCGGCHGTGSTTSGIKQIDLKEHNTDHAKCIDCHIAHSPLTFKDF